ncbi:hypothetical protein AV530_019266 [Patagioenas fasciata monilis]|uniref:Uncharacterized protein n=1 Tax=Patagioenas fasciata monilis TaxID=372326 RepID=A0A1V4JD51_PATFA|nr:hypothetical protein AV530_019266 [Patagioenas fasciata monilis]
MWIFSLFGRKMCREEHSQDTAFQQVVSGAVYEEEWFLLGSAIALSQHQGVSVMSSKSFLRQRPNVETICRKANNGRVQTRAARPERMFWKKFALDPSPRPSVMRRPQRCGLDSCSWERSIVVTIASIAALSDQLSPVQQPWPDGVMDLTVPSTTASNILNRACEHQVKKSNRSRWACKQQNSGSPTEVLRSGEEQNVSTWCHFLSLLQWEEPDCRRIAAYLPSPSTPNCRGCLGLVTPRVIRVGSSERSGSSTACFREPKIGFLCH